MLKKRIIFTLLYCDGYFVQSRNFNLQKVGDVNWIKKNYDFKKISYYIDELAVLDISRKKRNLDLFIKNLNLITKFSFIPVSVGGGISCFDEAKKILSNGADKIIINSNLRYDLLKEISKTYGQQSIIASLDFKKEGSKYELFSNNGSKKIDISIKDYLKKISKYPVGEILINSIDKDGTGNGLELDVLKYFPDKIDKSVIISGGCGNSMHISAGLKNKKVDAVNTANLLNFMGDGLKKAREDMINNNFKLPTWNEDTIKKIRNIFK
jgi:cyclase